MKKKKTNICSISFGPKKSRREKWKERRKIHSNLSYVTDVGGKVWCWSYICSSVLVAAVGVALKVVLVVAS